MIKHSPMHDKASLLKGQAQVANAQAQMANIPSPEMQMFDDMRGTLGPKDEPKTGWRAFLDGAFVGAKTAAAKEKHNIIKKNMEYLERLNNEMGIMLKDAKEDEAQMKAIGPYAGTAFSLSYSGGNHETVNNSMRNLFNQMRINVPGSIPPGSEYVGFIPNTAIINTIDSEGNPQAIDFTPYVDPDHRKETIKGYNDGLLNKIKQDESTAYVNNQNSMADLHKTQKEQLPKKLDIREEEAENAKNRLELETGKSIDKAFGESIRANQSFLRDADRIENIVDSHPEIFQSLSQIQWSNQDPGYLEQIRRDLQSKHDPETAEAISSMVKYINKMTIDVAKGFKRPNMFIEKIGSKAVPNFNMPPKAFKKILSEMKEDAKHRLEEDKSLVSSMDQTEGKRFVNSYFGDHSQVNQQSNHRAQQDHLANNNQKVKVRDPKTGEEHELSLEKAEIAIKRGGIKVG